MKLSGNKRNGRYISGNQRYLTPQNNRSQEEQFVGPRAAKAAAKRKKARRARRILIIILVVLLALAAVLYCVYKFGVTPPPVKPRPNQPIVSDGGAAVSDDAAAPDSASSGRKDNQFTFLIVGISGGNTDTMMVANFDATAHKLNVVSIPRDTLVNVEWSTKKANSLFPNKGIDGLLAGVQDILGFPVDFYVEVDLRAFTELVDAIGGVEFDVPTDMKYDDPAQDLHINLQKGLQTLDGAHAIQLVRCRSVYATADIGRIETQQAFMKAAADQIIKKQNQINLTELVSIFTKYVKSDLNAGNLIWLGKEFYKTDSQNITLSTIPANYWDTVNKTSYVTIYVNEWLQVINSQLNPYKEDITVKQLSILTRNEKGELYVTNGVWAGKKTWGSGSSSSSSNTDKPAASSKPSAEPSPSPSEPSPSTEPSPSDSASPSPSDSASPSPSEDSSPDISPTDTGTDTSPGETPSTNP